jgi:hypothetical protein
VKRKSKENHLDTDKVSARERNLSTATTNYRTPDLLYLFVLVVLRLIGGARRIGGVSATLVGPSTPVLLYQHQMGSNRSTLVSELLNWQLYHRPMLKDQLVIE